MTQAVELARRVKVHVAIGGHDATNRMEPYLLDFSFTDNATGKADEVRITLHDRDGKWNNEWKPKKGTEVTATIVCSDWFKQGDSVSLPCGRFRIDEIEFSGPPDKITIKAVTSALTTGLRDTPKTRAWENTSLQTVAGQVAAEHGLALHYEGDPHLFSRQDQRNESDLPFVDRMAEERGMFCKAHDSRLVMVDRERAENVSPKIAINRRGGQTTLKPLPRSGLRIKTAPGDAEFGSEKLLSLSVSGEAPLTATAAQKYSFKQASSKTAYSEAQASYTDPSKGKTHTAVVKTPEEERDHKLLVMDKRAEDSLQAIRLSKARLNQENSKENTATLEVMGHPGIVAGITLDLTGFGDFSGRYIVKKAEHKVGGSGGYTTSLELSKCRLNPDVLVKAGSAEVAARPAAAPSLPVNNASAWEAAFLALREFWLLSGVDDLTKLLFCLPNIADAMAGKVDNAADAQGWLHLRSMFQHWFGGRASTASDAADPFWVDWDWVMSYARTREKYALFTQNSPEPSAEVGPNIKNDAALASLGRILCRDGYMRDERVDFDFTVLPWTKWQDAYHTHIPVPRPSEADGLMAAMGAFTLRALAAGWTEPDGKGGHIVHVTKMAVFVHDVFNFDPEQAGDAIGLRYWNCENLHYSGTKEDGYTELDNEKFRNFRSQYDHGGDFLVLSQPHAVENFSGEQYKYVCAKQLF
ncbi:MAG: DUF6402 family protein [Desulfovibrio sp.]|jgi:phage protein D|nr:DUF6402 family protein [Desulfovibrio sp.]